MRIRSLELIRYGKFTDHLTEFPADGLDLHLVVGPNEAGKSTTRAALTELLFGVDHRTRYAFLHDYANLRIGAELEHDGERLTVRRKKGNRNTLLDASERPLPDALLSAFLGNVHRDAFLRMFSLDHESLVEGAKELLDAKDDVGRMLFQASGGLHRLGELRRELDTEADQLWAPRRSKDRAFYTALDQFQKASTDLERLTVRVKDFRAAEERVTSTQAAVTDCDTKQDSLLRQCLRLERIRRTLPGLARRRNLERELAEYDSSMLLPENAARLLQEAQTELVRTEDERQRLVEQLDTLRQSIGTRRPNATILRYEPDIALLAERRHELRRFPDDIAKRRTEVQLLRTQVEEHLTEIGWQRLGIEELKQRLPSALEMESIEQLLALHDRHALTISNAREALSKRQAELAELLVAQDTSLERGAPERLREAVEVARQLGDVETRRRELAVPAELSKKRLIVSLSYLAPWQGDLATLRAILAPSDEEVERLTQLFERQDKEEELVQAELDRNALRLDSLRLKEAQIVRDASPVTRGQLESCRNVRDEQWHSLRQTLLTPDAVRASIAEILPRYEVACGRADELADRRFDAASASVAVQQLRNEIEQIEQLTVHAEERLAKLRAQRTVLVERLQRLTHGEGLEFVHPSQLRKWLLLRNDALLHGEVAERERLNLLHFEKQVAVCEADLRGAFEETKAADAANGPPNFRTLLRVAVNEITQLDEARARQRTLAQHISNVQRDLPELKAAVERAETALADWNRTYEKALRKLGVPLGAGPSTAKTALYLLREASAKLAKSTDIERERIDTMTRDLELFKRDVDEVVQVTALELPDGNPFERASHLLERLAHEKELARETARIEALIRELSQKLTEVERRHAEATATITPLLALACVEDVVSLSAAVERSNRKRELLHDKRQTELALLEAGDGLSLEELESDITSLDVSLLDRKLEEYRETLRSLAQTKKDLDLAHTDATRALAAIAGGSAAASVATTRNEAIANMAETIERYLRVRTMSVLLKWVLERFRREKQGPLLSRASELFAILTLEQFTGLTVESDDDERPQLLGVRASGKVITLDSMSTGTTDQLYLALRLAALELHLETSRSLPFIADDLFVHFDDVRSAAAFKVLSMLAARTQVIFFTHHEHLVEVATQALGSAVHVTRF